MALIKLITGLIATAVIGIELAGMPVDQSTSAENQGKPLVFSGVLFRILLAIVIGMAIYSVAPEFAKWILNASYHQILGSLLLTGMGILILGITNRPFRVLVGLLTFLSGFEILFATLETSSIVAGFFALTSLGISLLGAYFIGSPEITEEI
jgi:hypothetical protein